MHIPLSNMPASVGGGGGGGGGGIILDFLFSLTQKQQVQKLHVMLWTLARFSENSPFIITQKNHFRLSS